MVEILFAVIVFMLGFLLGYGWGIKDSKPPEESIEDELDRMAREHFPEENDLHADMRNIWKARYRSHIQR